MAGLLMTFILSGRLVSRTGRYKIVPDPRHGDHRPRPHPARHRCTPARPTCSSPLYMFVVGLGLGLVMQVLVVAVQNTVPHALLGTATSTATFFRTIGGAFGVAALGTVFNNRLISQVRASGNPALAEARKGGSIAANPAQIRPLPPARDSRSSTRSATRSRRSSSSRCPSPSSPSSCAGS